MKLARRSFLLGASVLAAPTAAWARDLSRGAFTSGVASGDPTPTAVIIWTRFVGASDGRIAWEVAADEAFANLVARGHAEARLANDYCVKVDVGGLQPGRPYFYRFLSASGPSVTGLTRTAPAPASDEPLGLALFSCSNFPFGYFHAYGHAAERADIDIAVHVGDYIYEMPRGAYPSAREAVPGRVIDPAGEIITLGDYYQRYATYHTDPDLLELRRVKPICVVWDDHEIANNTWKNGAQNHQPATEGAFADRIAAASKAYFDWMPIRRPDPTRPRIYRSLDWGALARIILLDTRYIGRDLQLDYRGEPWVPQLAQGGAEAAAAIARFRAEKLDDPNRSLLGAPQEQWLSETLAASKAAGQTWQILAQQIVAAPQMAPSALLDFLPEDVSAGSRAWFSAGAQLAAAGLPWNLDSWDGYPPARTRLLEACLTHANNAVMLGGDSHNCWINNLAAPGKDRLAGVEFAGGSVTSPGFEATLRNAGPGAREAAMRAANPALAFCDVTNRGYGALKFSRTALDAEWVAFTEWREPARPEPQITPISTAPSAAAGPGPWSVHGA